MAKSSRSKSQIVILIFLAFLSLATAFFRLGSKGLWGDEIWQVSWAQQQSFLQTFIRFTIFNELDRLRNMTNENLPGLVSNIDNYPLHFMWVHLTTKLGESEFWVRFPSALLGALSVLAMFFLSQKLFGQETALVAAVLLALAPYHVWYAQDARAYSALIFYSLISLYFFVVLMERPSWKAWLGFTLGTVLNLYNHFLANLPLLLEFTVSIGLGIIWLWRTRLSGINSETAAFRKMRRSLLAIWSGCVLAAIIALPVLSKAAIFIKLRGVVPGQNARFQLTSQFIKTLFISFGAGKGIALYVFVLLAIIGIGAAFYKRFWFGFLTFIWIIFPLAALGVLQPQRFIPLRYLLFIQPLYLLMAALGSVQVLGALRRIKDRLLPRFSLRQKSSSWVPLGLVLCGFFMATFPLTWKGYWVEKVNDWSAICSYFHSQAKPGDMIIGAGHTLGVMDLWCYRERNGVSVVGPDRYSLDELKEIGRNIWYLSLEDEQDDSRLSFLKRNFEKIPKTDYARLDLLPPDYNCGGRLFFPQCESPVNIFRFKTNFVPASIKFKDLPGLRGWPDYARVQPGDHYDVFLSLPATASRGLQITTLDFKERDLVLYANDKMIAEIKGGISPGKWVTHVFTLPSSVPDTFLLKMSNPGSKAFAVSRVEVRYIY